MENAKVKRSMYAETQKERREMLDAVRASGWNREVNPLAVGVRSGEVVRHEFSKGYVRIHCVQIRINLNYACRSLRIPVTFVLRNLSLTNSARYTLRLAPRPPPSITES